MKLEWNKYFDKIYCTHFLPYKDRLPRIKEEFERVDILNSGIFEWNYTVPNNLYNYVFLSHKNFKNQNNTVYKGVMKDNINRDTPEATNSNIDFRFINNTNINLTISMIDVLYQAKYSGYKRILFLEDDIFFLKDKQIIKMLLDRIPEDYDVINFDPFIYDTNKFDDSKTVNCFYIDTSRSEVYNGSCIALTSNMIDYILLKQEAMLLPWDNYITCKNIEVNDGIQRYIPFMNMCIQRDYEIRQEYFYENTKDSKYRNMKNVNMNNYSELEGIL